jgi:hypothetical protein
MNWVVERLKEKSTYAGLAMILASIGLGQWSVVVEHVGSILMIVLGTGLVAATTKR